MCKTVIIEEHGLECATHGALKAALGGEPVYRHVGDAEENDCLCDLAVEQTADRFGYEVADERAGMFIVFAPKTPVASNLS